MKSLMAQAQDNPAAEEPAAGAFQKPDLSDLVPDEIKDAVARVVAAGHKLIYSAEMADEVQAAIASQDPVPKKLADNVAGLLLTLDQQAQGGIPEAAIFPAGMELIGEAAEVLAAAGQQVTQEDYNEAARMLYATIGQKLGHTQDELMGAAEQVVGQAEAPVEDAPHGEMPVGAPEAA